MPRVTGIYLLVKTKTYRGFMGKRRTFDTAAERQGPESWQLEKAHTPVIDVSTVTPMILFNSNHEQTVKEVSGEYETSQETAQEPHNKHPYRLDEQPRRLRPPPFVGLKYSLAPGSPQTTPFSTCCPAREKGRNLLTTSIPLTLPRALIQANTPLCSILNVRSM